MCPPLGTPHHSQATTNAPAPALTSGPRARGNLPLHQDTALAPGDNQFGASRRQSKDAPRPPDRLCQLQKVHPCTLPEWDVLWMCIDVVLTTGWSAPSTKSKASAPAVKDTIDNPFASAGQLDNVVQLAMLPKYLVKPCASSN